MITPMLKYQFLAFHKDVNHLLETLKNLGVVHIKELKRNIDEHSARIKRELAANKQLKINFERSLQAGADPSPKLKSFNPELVHEYLEELQQLNKKIPRLEEEEYHVRFFGNYDAFKFNAIEEKGVFFHLFSVSLGKIKPEWKKEYAIHELFETSRKSYFVILSNETEPPKIKAQIEEFPSKSVKQLQQEIAELKDKKAGILAEFLRNQDIIHQYIEENKTQLNDELQNQKADNQLIKMGFGKVLMLQGWIPKNKAEILEAALDATGFYYEKQKPEPKDAPPILLKNSALAKWMEPIAELFALPKYAELDLTPFFAPFFLLFFGFCLGDGGYGLLIFLVLLSLYKKVPKAYKNIWKLALALEFMAFPIGIISGTFFGINLFETDIPLLTNLRPYMLDADGLFNFALVLGAIQICFGLIIKAVNQTKQFGISYAFSPIGWIILLFGLGYGYLQEFNLIAKTTSWIGVGLVVIFSDPKAGIGTRLGKGLWDLYGITGFFGDLLSYIRLFALGLAGSILGFVVNDIALSILGSHQILGPIFFVIMLIIGHGLNIFIASLGAFVHPMRLTFVEFYKNAGFTGGGEAYQPLKNLKTKTQKL